MTSQDNKNIDENVKLDTNNDVLDIKKILPKRKSYKVLVLSSFFNELRKDKLYLLCLIITLITIFCFSLNKVKDADGVFTNDKNATKEVNETLDDKLDVTNYVGYYVKSYKLNKKIRYNTCEFTNYDLVYEIKKDNTISRYMVNDCVGTLLIYSDSLGYVKNGKTRNIGTKSYIYVFNNDKLTQSDGLSYTKNNKYVLDDEIKDINDTGISFIKDKFTLLGNKELYLVNGNVVETEIIVKSLLAKSIYRVVGTNDYKYIVYNDGETEICYDRFLVLEDGFEDKESYKIYEVKFDEDNLSFGEPKLIESRKRSDNCEVLDDDITRLSN